MNSATGHQPYVAWRAGTTIYTIVDFIPPVSSGTAFGAFLTYLTGKCTLRNIRLRHVPPNNIFSRISELLYCKRRQGLYSKRVYGTYRRVDYNLTLCRLQHMYHGHGQPYARVDFIPQSGNKILASGWYLPLDWGWDFACVCWWVCGNFIVDAINTRTS
jgi:hypothetical protein